MPEKGGVQVVVDWITKGIGDSFKFSVLSTSKTGESSNLKHTDHLSAKSYGQLFSLPIAPAIVPKIWLNLRKFDLVAVHYPFPLADIAIAIYPFKLPKIVIYWHSEIVSQRLSSLLIKPFTLLMLKRADRIICSSPRLIDQSKLLRTHRRKCVVIPFGVPINIEDHTEPLFSMPSDSDYYLTIARHVPYKGLNVLIRAMPMTDNSFRLKIVGSGPLLEQHKKLAVELNLDSRIDFVSNASDKEVSDMIKTCRALILPSILPSEAFGLVQIEAMIHARPIINTNLASGVPWVARDSIEAITVKPNDAEELAAAIVRLSDDALLNSLGRAAQKRAQNVFNYTEFCEHTKNLYNEILRIH